MYGDKNPPRQDGGLSRQRRRRQERQERKKPSKFSGRSRLSQDIDTLVARAAIAAAFAAST